MVLLAWLGYALTSGLPIHNEFLGFPNIEGASPWLDVLIFDAFLVWSILRAPPITVRIARLATILVGLSGLGWLFIAPLIRAGTLHLTAEHLIGSYIWASHLGLAVSWPSKRGTEPNVSANGGPAKSVGTSGVTDGPPSAS